jgi:hypothetical protein
MTTGLGISVYRLFRFWRLQIIGTSVLFWAIAIAMLAADAAGLNGPPWPFALLWSAACVYITLSFLLRVPYELTLADGLLAWKTPMRSGSVPVSEIRELRPYPSGPNAELIQLEDGRRLIVLMRKGFQQFLDDLSRAAPGLSLTVSPYFSKLAERSRFQTGSGYEHHD